MCWHTQSYTQKSRFFLPQSVNTYTQMSLKRAIFYEVDNFRRVKGFINDTHRTIKPSVAGAEDYYHHRYLYSVTLQSVFAEDMKCIDMCWGWPWWFHDWRELNHSHTFNLYSHLFNWCYSGHAQGDNENLSLGSLFVPYIDNRYLGCAQIKYNKKESIMNGDEITCSHTKETITGHDINDGVFAE